MANYQQHKIHPGFQQAANAWRMTCQSRRRHGRAEVLSSEEHPLGTHPGANIHLEGKYWVHTLGRIFTSRAVYMVHTNVYKRVPASCMSTNRHVAWSLARMAEISEAVLRYTLVGEKGEDGLSQCWWVGNWMHGSLAADNCIRNIRRTSAIYGDYTTGCAGKRRLRFHAHENLFIDHNSQVHGQPVHR